MPVNRDLGNEIVSKSNVIMSSFVELTGRSACLPSEN